MAVLEYPLLLSAQIILIIISIRWFLRRNDVLPLLVSTFLFYVASYRYWAVTSGMGRWVNITAFLTNSPQVDALNALACIVFGQICFLGTYWYYQKQTIPVAKVQNNNLILTWLKPKVLYLGLFCLPIVTLTRSSVIAQVQQGKSLAFQVSGYIYLFPMVLVGIAILTVTLWKFGGLTTIFNKFVAIVILLGVFYFTYNLGSRFQFLGWIIASGMILSSVYRPRKRFLILSLTVILAMSLFAIAGATRDLALSDSSLENAAMMRALNAEDANMLDGFVIVRSVFPQHLDFRWGMEHLEILMRPIPRSLWPNKPVGGAYMEFLGLSDAETGITVGFSPTLFGSFYIDGGIIGIIIWSFIYGRTLAGIVNYSLTIQSFAGVFVRAILCACLIPLLRGGDLAGVYSWFGMAFWPCFLFLWFKRHDLKHTLSSSRQLLLQHHR